MSGIKAKIIGNQVWTTENLTRAEYKLITGRNIPEKNENWSAFTNPKCFAYNSKIKKNKREYLFDLNSVLFLSEYSRMWRIPNIKDLEHLSKSTDSNAYYGWETEELAINLRGTYGWLNNGINKVGFNAYPNPTYNGEELHEFEISRWWYNNEISRSFNGFSLYEDNIIAVSGPYNENDGLAIRLVMNLSEPRVEENIIYV